MFRSCSYFVAVAIGFVAFSADAATLPPNYNSMWYYEMGGAQPIMPPAGNNVVVAPIGAGLAFNASYSCGKFDPMAAFTEQMDELKQGAEQMEQQMISAAGAAVASLPSLILQRASPGLYELFRNYTIGIKEKIALATKSCEEMEAQISNNTNPFDKWVTVSKGNDWKYSMGVGGSVIKAQDYVENNSGNNGVPFVFTDQGGIGQRDIEMTGDVVYAGFNQIVGRPPNAGTALTSGPNAHPIRQYFDSPDTIEAWTKDVVGELTVRTCQGCERAVASPGLGLLPKQKEKFTQLYAQLSGLANGNQPLTTSALESLSAGNVLITPQLVEVMRNADPLEREVLVQRFSSELATTYVQEQAYYAKLALQAGKDLPQVQAYDDAKEHAEKITMRLQEHIDELDAQYRKNYDYVSNTAMKTIAREAQDRKASLGAGGNSQGIGRMKPINPITGSTQ